MEFTKMHGCGNDYAYVFGKVKNPSNLAKKISDRNKGIGADGLVLILPSKVADARMQMFNADGSEGAMCGNAIRCVAKLLFDTKLVTSPLFAIETKSGIKTVVYDEKTRTATVDMGTPKVISKGFVNHIDVGNPHAVVFVDDTEKLDLPALGNFFEKNPYFKGGVNTEFVRVIGKNSLEMRVWERGSGETLACGTGAVASAVAAVEHGFCEKNKDISIKLRGGELVINVNDERAYLMGGCETVFKGVYDESK